MKKKKQAWGGKRVGSGRKRKHDPLLTYSVHMTAHQAALLKEWGGGCLDLGVNWLINTAEILICKCSVPILTEECNEG